MRQCFPPGTEKEDARRLKVYFLKNLVNWLVNQLQIKQSRTISYVVSASTSTREELRPVKPLERGTLSEEKDG